MTSTRPNKWLEKARVEFDDQTGKLNKQCEEQTKLLDELRKERTDLQTKLAEALAQTETAVARDAFDEAKAEISEKEQQIGELRQSLLVRDESVSNLTKELEELKAAVAPADGDAIAADVSPADEPGVAA